MHERLHAVREKVPLQTAHDRQQGRRTGDRRAPRPSPAARSGRRCPRAPTGTAPRCRAAATWPHAGPAAAAAGSPPESRRGVNSRRTRHAGSVRSGRRCAAAARVRRCGRRWSSARRRRRARRGSWSDRSCMPPAAPKLPTGRPAHVARCAWQQSSMTARPWRSATCVIAGMSAACPYRWTGRIAAVRDVTAAAAAAGSSVRRTRIDVRKDRPRRRPS